MISIVINHPYITIGVVLLLAVIIWKRKYIRYFPGTGKITEFETVTLMHEKNILECALKNQDIPYKYARIKKAVGVRGQREGDPWTGRMIYTYYYTVEYWQ